VEPSESNVLNGGKPGKDHFVSLIILLPFYVITFVHILNRISKVIKIKNVKGG
jgi:hypothetical protein